MSNLKEPEYSSSAYLDLFSGEKTEQGICFYVFYLGNSMVCLSFIMYIL